MERDGYCARPSQLVHGITVSCIDGYKPTVLHQMDAIGIMPVCELDGSKVDASCIQASTTHRHLVIHQTEAPAIDSGSLADAFRPNASWIGFILRTPILGLPPVAPLRCHVIQNAPLCHPSCLVSATCSSALIMFLRTNPQRIFLLSGVNSKSQSYDAVDDSLAEAVRSRPKVLQSPTGAFAKRRPDMIRLSRSCLNDVDPKLCRPQSWDDPTGSVTRWL